MKFTLAQIEAFIGIVDAGTFHAAAQRLHLAQPTVSQRIRELEAALGAPVFVRHGPRIQLTSEGHALVGYSRRLLGGAAELANYFQRGSPLKGELRLGVPTTFSLVCLTELLQQLTERYPALKTSVHVHDSFTMMRMIEEHDLDIAILVEPAATRRSHERFLGRDELAWLASPNLRLPSPIGPAELADLPIMLTPTPSRLYTTVMEWFSAAGVIPNQISMCNNIMAIMQIIANGVAVSVLPLRIMQTDIARKRVRRLKVVPELTAHKMSICHQIEGLGPEVESVVELICELISQHRLYE